MKGEFKFWKDFFLALLILQIALIIVTGVASFFMVGGVMEPSAMGFGNYANIITSSGPLILLTMGVSLIVGVISLIVQLGLMKGVDARLNGKAFTLQEGFSFGTSKIVVAIIASIITGLLVFFGLFFLVLPGIYLFVSLSLILPAIAIGDKEVGSSISESFRLIKGRWFKSFGLGITVFLVAVAYGIAVGIVLIPLTLIFGVLSNLGSGAMLFSSLLNQILQAVLVIPLNLFGMVVLAMYYRNLKELPPSIKHDLPTIVRSELGKMSAQKQEEFLEEYKRKQKSVGIGYLLWFLGFHYAYVGNWGLFVVYWLTLGGFFICTIIDLFRIPGIIRNYNQDVATDVLRTMRAISSK